MLIAFINRAGTTESRQLEYFYRNMHFFYQWHIRRIDVPYTGTKQDRNMRILHWSWKEGKNKAPDREIFVAVYNCDEWCWRCKQKGHTWFECRRLLKKFCSQYSKESWQRTAIRRGETGHRPGKLRPLPGHQRKIYVPAARWHILPDIRLDFKYKVDRTNIHRLGNLDYQQHRTHSGEIAFLHRGGRGGNSPRWRTNDRLACNLVNMLIRIGNRFAQRCNADA